MSNDIMEGGQGGLSDLLTVNHHTPNNNHPAGSSSHFGSFGEQPRLTKPTKGLVAKSANTKLKVSRDIQEMKTTGCPATLSLGVTGAGLGSEGTEEDNR
jgi:hypothetical protein